MARTLNPQSHAVKRDAFVDVGQRLIQTKGYEAFTVQDVLDELDASKGAFYHYFGSKADLLEAVVERMADAVEITWADPMSRPGLSARERLEAVFALTAQWKNARRELVLGVLDAWMSDHNAIVRDKLRALVASRMTTLLTAILRQGVADGDFSVTDPEASAHVIVGLVQTVQERAGELFVARQDGRIEKAEVSRTFEAFAEAFERIVGLSPHTVRFVDPQTIDLWFS
ncbi:MAG TPA: TetR/AcrR family transcriptional regulator [Candidatus Limnocylindrales bacterium]|nr:TetR/AcrR family transcriptional regulator [Candidatus Limnocylindrales bacterium]